MSGKESKFDIWWNSPSMKRAVGAAYSLGAAVVIIGAMFKILHLPGAAQMLGIGMSCEAVLFALGVFDKPHKEYEWDKVFGFDEENKLNLSGSGMQLGGGEAQMGAVQPVRAVGLNYTETIDDEDVKKLQEGIRNLTNTAQQFAGLSQVVGATDLFVKTIDEAAAATGKFTQSQEVLNTTTGQLANVYQEISNGMDTIDKNTKLYVGRVEDINKNLSSINSIYEIQLKNIEAQSEAITQQTDRVKIVNDDLNAVVDEVQKMKAATLIAAEESLNFKVGTEKLAKQVADLNQVYGNMLNALS